jgi:hypothetical protein
MTQVPEVPEAVVVSLFMWKFMAQLPAVTIR